MADVNMVADDRLPSLEVACYDANGAVNLTGASAVVFHLQAADGSKKIDGTAATISSTSPGRLRYDWAADDLDTAGTYKAWFTVTVNSKAWSFPNGDPLTVEVREV